MENADLICRWIAELVPLFAALFAFIYGLNKFFKKGKPLFLQSITMAMGSHALGSIYHVCHTLTTQKMLEGFTPAYLGRIGFFLFLIAASYGQMDRIVDDGSKKLRPSRCLALIAPLCAVLLYLPSGMARSLSVATKVSYLLLWLPSCFSVYYNLKHAILPDLDFGFVRAIKPYNLFATCLGFMELLRMTAWSTLHNTSLVLSSLGFALLCVATMFAAKKGAERWTI